MPVTMSASGLPIGSGGVCSLRRHRHAGSGRRADTLTIQLPSDSHVAIVTPYRTPYAGVAGPRVAFGLCMLRRHSARRPASAEGCGSTLACTGLAAAALVIAGCNGGFPSPPFTPNGTYVVTITGTSGLLHSSTTVTIHVQ